MDQFITQYKKMGKRRKKCRICSKLIQDGESVFVRKFIQEKYYPVKGIMKFSSWHYFHSECKNKENEK